MKNKNIKLPLLFIISGMLIIFAVSGYSIKKYVKNSKKGIEPASESINNNTGENLKLFFEKPSVTPKNTLVIVYKSKRILELYGDGNLIGRFSIGLGRAPLGSKVNEGDNKTPEGNYYICTLNNQTKYYFFMGLSYPNEIDAKRGLDDGIINKASYDSIVKAINNKQQPPWNTALGGEIGIHGGGSKYDWTYGCIALSNEDLKILRQYTPINTPVQILK